MHSTYLPVLGFLAIFLGCITNSIALCSIRKEKSLQVQRDLLTCITASRILFCAVISLWWIAWISYHGWGFEKAIYVIYSGLNLFYILVVLGMTVDRLVAVAAPLQYKAMTIEIIHRIFVLTILAVSLLTTTVFALWYKNRTIQAYTTLVIDAIFLLAIISANFFIQKKWIKRMSLAKKIGAIGRALQKIDASMNKIGSFIGLCACVSTLADIYFAVTELYFPAKMGTDLSGFVVLFISCLYAFQPLYCIAVGLDLSVKDLKEGLLRKRCCSMQKEMKHSYFRNIQSKTSWAYL